MELIMDSLDHLDTSQIKSPHLGYCSCNMENLQIYYSAAQ